MNTEESVREQLGKNASQSTSVGAASASASNSSMDVSEADYSMVKEEDKENLNKWLVVKDKIKALESEVNHREKAKKAREIAAEMIANLTFIFKLFRDYPTIEKEYAENQALLTRLSSIMNASAEALKSSAIEYFKRLYPMSDPNKDFAFSNKKSGDQVGQTLRISYHDEDKKQREVFYYIKTHQNGSSSRDGSSAGDVDLKELFVYKMLEKMGIGPKAHFFSTPFSTQNGFYIATRGFPFSKSMEKQKDKFFYIYSQFEHKNKLDEVKDLTTIPVDGAIIHELTKIDIVSRVFKLIDVATNAGNFGFACRGDKMKCKIIDFRVGIYHVYGYEEGLLSGFIAGNGTYNYLGFVGMALRNREPSDKVAEARAVIADLTENTKTNFFTSSEGAYKEILTFVENNSGIWRSKRVLEAALSDLKDYHAAINENFAKFSDEVKLVKTVTQQLTFS